ncbi:hypothetical protein NDU88_005653 [Pleurodeles waltl]|uniref:Uncharacterized protein n=1 Tax=Pleurodeles waltl TaxID=8319 RepID=A0AAV7NSW1_PLEWA|nr:hypothetical protein NDU88_005653 [Pleurodeles waltl]
MGYYAEEDEYYQDFPEGNDGYQMKERLDESLDYHVQDSVNQALIKALKPFTPPLRRYGQRKLRGRVPNLKVSRGDRMPDFGLAHRSSVGPASSAEVLAQMAASVLKDHEYDPFSSLRASDPALGLSTVSLDASPLPIPLIQNKNYVSSNLQVNANASPGMWKKIARLREMYISIRKPLSIPVPPSGYPVVR